MAIENINLGILSSTPTPLQHHSVSPSEPYDIYRFRLDSPGNINLSLTGTSADADVVLYRDVNNNGVIDEGVDTWIQSSTYGFNNAHDEAINVVAQAGNYIAKVYSYQGTNSTSYDLSLSTTPSHSSTPSNLLSTEVSVGGLSNSRDNPATISTFNDFVGDSDTTDVYAFSVDSTIAGVEITLSGLSTDADIRLIRDSNSNHIVDAGEEIYPSQNNGISSEHISVWGNDFGHGDFLLQVYQYSGDTSYQLTFAPFFTL